METPHPRVAVGVLIFKDGKLLLGKRLVKGFGYAHYCGPGGHTEFGETFEETAIRETREEAGIEIQHVRPVCLVTFLREDRHYADIGVAADWKSGKPKAMEPDKCAGWDWYGMEHLPAPLWQHVPFYLESIKTGIFYQGTVR